MQSLERLMRSDLTQVTDITFQTMVNNETLQLLERYNQWTPDEFEIADIILKISNILYNNTTIQVLLLDDGVYDQLLETYKRYMPVYPVGAPPIAFQQTNQQSNIVQNLKQEKKLMYRLVTDEMKNDPFFSAIHDKAEPRGRPRPKTMYTLVRDPITKRLINTIHKYPQLVGTLDKCKFVLNADARRDGAYDTPAVKIFERDYMMPLVQSGFIDYNQPFEMVCELKYDGVSVEAEVRGDRLITALSRGDTANDVATDLTPILGGYRFYNATGHVADTEVFGIKFEAVITKDNLDLLGKIRGRQYKNSRNAIIGLLGASDAYRFRDFITLIPLSTSLQMYRGYELEFLNKFYSSEHPNRFVIFQGTYVEIMNFVRQFVKAAEIIRPMLPYMIDGVVVSFTNPDIIRSLGRIGSVNKWQMAIKFNPKEVRTIFLGYTFNIGKSGEVIPMVNFKPVEFIGTIHTKQTIHSFQRFKDLHLIKGQEIDIKYVNEVITYVTKPDTPYNQQLEATGAYEPFISKCPYCGTPIILSETMKSARCPNVHCRERLIMRMVSMLDTLGFKDFSEETVRTLDLTSFLQLVKPYVYESLVQILGPITAKQFITYQKQLIENPIADYHIMAALGFDGMAEEKWKRVLSYVDLDLLYKMDINQMIGALKPVHGVGRAIIESISAGFVNYNDEVGYVVNHMKIIKSRSMINKPKVVITGSRDSSLIELLNKYGFDCSDKYSLTKDTYCLITNDLNSTSSKMQKAAKYRVPIMTVDQFFEAHHIEL